MVDNELKGNEKIEEYIELLQKDPSDEVLAAVLSAIRRRMKEGGQFIVPVEASVTETMQIRAMKMNGKKWLGVFTSFDEELKGENSVMSTFMADISQILNMVMAEPTLEGLILNPWNKRLVLNKTLIQVILG